MYIEVCSMNYLYRRMAFLDYIVDWWSLTDAQSVINQREKQFKIKSNTSSEFQIKQEGD